MPKAETSWSAQKTKNMLVVVGEFATPALGNFQACTVAVGERVLNGLMWLENNQNVCCHFTVFYPISITYKIIANKSSKPFVTLYR